MNIILLSGGSGKRLWPLSNDIRSKQFIKVFKKEDGEYESMLQRMYKGIKEVNKDSNVTIATSSTQTSIIKNQLGENIDISIEPCRRDTFPAIALATAYLHDVKKISTDESVVVCPVDPYVESDYFKTLEKLYEVSNKGNFNLSLIGIKPTYPSEKYGYIIPEEKDKLSKVKTFKEKPNVETAKEYIKEGALWNAGVFAYKIGYVLDIAHKLIDFEDYYDLYDKYETLNKISFDYAVVEKEDQIQVLPFDGLWKDLGTWNTLTESMNERIMGKGVFDEKSKNSYIINELNVPVLGMGLEDIIVAASPDGILVSKKDESSYIKPYVENFKEQVRYAEKSWGTYKVINIEDESQTVLVTLNPGHSMKYHSHDNRDEVWTVVSGEGVSIIDDMEQIIRPGDVITIDAGCKHTVLATTQLKLVEVQIGKEITVEDKNVYKLTRK
ncbi:MAG: cupin domain-containing protein [Firmicutes bacterium]|nr:cupin domain-containing protein [Bacillota bacterium]